MFGVRDVCIKLCPVLQSLTLLVRSGKYVWPGLEPQLKSTESYFKALVSETVVEMYPSCMKGYSSKISSKMGNQRKLFTDLWPQVMASTFDELQVCYSHTCLHSSSGYFAMAAACALLPALLL